MSDEFSFKNLPEVINALTRYGTKAEQAMAYGVGKVALAVQAEAVKLLSQTGRKAIRKGERIVGAIPPRHIGPSGSPPNTLTGLLKKSIFTSLHKGFGTYQAHVFPSTEYARALEFGNPKVWKSGVKYPYMKPASDLVRPRANQIFAAEYSRRMRG